MYSTISGFYVLSLALNVIEDHLVSAELSLFSSFWRVQYRFEKCHYNDISTKNTLAGVQYRFEKCHYNYISTKNTLAVKMERPRGLGKKEVKSKWAAKACVVLLLMEIKF